VIAALWLIAALIAPHAVPAAAGTTPSPAATPATPAGSAAPSPQVTATAPSPASTAPAPGPASAAPATAPAANPAAPAMPSPAVVPATPSPSPYNYRFVPRQPAHPKAGLPQIFAVYLNDKKLRSNGPIRIKVQTTPDVVKVVSRSNGRDGIIPLMAPGDFEATSVLPKIPFIAAGMTLDLEFIATTAEGQKAVVRVPVRLD